MKNEWDGGYDDDNNDNVMIAEGHSYKINWFWTDVGKITSAIQDKIKRLSDYYHCHLQGNGLKIMFLYLKPVKVI
jgi:hypothetical protein